MQTLGYPNCTVTQKWLSQKKSLAILQNLTVSFGCEKVLYCLEGLTTQFLMYISGWNSTGVQSKVTYQFVCLRRVLGGLSRLIPLIFFQILTVPFVCKTGERRVSGGLRRLILLIFFQFLTVPFVCKTVLYGYVFSILLEQF